jgi:hypothetical protein
MKLFKSNKELFKIENFKGLTYPKNYFDSCDKAYDKDWKPFLDNNPEFKTLLIKATNAYYRSGITYNIEDDMFCDFTIIGDLSKDLDIIYFQIDGQSSIIFLDNLNRCSGKYVNEKGWGIKEWIEIAQ